jgi:hypothetical protein
MLRLTPVVWLYLCICQFNNAQFLQMVKCARRMDDWGVAANLLCYCEYDKEHQKIHAKIHQLQLDLTAIDQDCALCEQWLEASQCAEGLAHLKGLGPKSTCAKWGTHFTNNEEDVEEQPGVCINC